MGIEPLEATQETFNPEIILSEEDIDESVIPVSYSDLYVLGKLWIQILKKALVGTHDSVFPVVEAAKPEGPPQKPAPMKYNDLPLYSSPHYEYKDYVENLHKCPKVNTKLLQEYLLPHVRSFRKCSQNKYCHIKCSLKEIKGEICDSIKYKQKDFKRMMRDPENLPMRRAIVVLGTSAGFVLGSGRSIPRQIFFTGLGALSTGALCFPKQTDEAFRTLTYHVAKAGLSFYNMLCGKEFMLRERLLCKDEVPPPPPPRKTNPCAKK